MIVSLAKQCQKETINSLVLGWIKDYDRSKTKFDPAEDLPRLYRWAKNKEDRLSSSVPQKRARSGIHTTTQTGGDMQMSSTKTETLQHPLVGNLPLHSDSKPSTDTVLPSRELPPPAAQQRQQHSAALMPHFGANSPIVDMSSMQPMSGVTSASAGSDFMDEYMNWDWASNLTLFNP
ncbi:hypothetical protein BDZ45DRAFT_681987 [Acephala macrosclerotiorum]|nr:hypothetical protein BDZ45DRAFT_681987 [Acephala macrosclerotiorum]